MNLEGKVALITGASHGIGAETVSLFSKLGIKKMFLTGRDGVALKTVKSSCIGNTDIVICRGDLMKSEFIDQLCGIVGDDALDILVNNAGATFENANLQGSDPDAFEKTMFLNFTQLKNLTQALIPNLKKAAESPSLNASIINVSSVVGIKPYQTLTAYSTSKGALEHFSKCLSLELAPLKIRVNTVCPGTVKTEFHKRALGLSEDQTEKFYEEGGPAAKSHPIGRLDRGIRC